MPEITERLRSRVPRRWTAAATASLVLGALVAAAPAPAAFPGTNGRIAVQGSNRLETMNSVGGDRRPLISQSGVVFSEPAWSPDGQRLAFTSNRDTGAAFEIYVTDPEGASITRLTTNAVEDNAPSWSPDGTKIVFESYRDRAEGEIYSMNANGTGVSRLTTNFFEDQAPVWSPDGGRIAFASAVPGTDSDIWTTTPAGAPPTRLTTDAAGSTNPDWSPDGARIAFQRGDSIVVMGADGSGPTPLPLPAPAARPAWAPDGTRIAFDVSTVIYTANPDGGAATPITVTGSQELNASNPNWQPIPVPAPPPPPPPPPPGPGPGGSADADGDGVTTPFDCNDADPAIRPGATDKPADGIDQDCSGRDARYPLLDRRVEAFLSTYPAGYTVFTSMAVKPVRRGDVLRLTCKGGGCPLKRKTVRVKKQARSLSLLRRLHGAKLRDGAVLQLRVTRPATIGRVTKWRIRAPKSAKITRSCLRPGKQKPSRCPG